MGESKAKETWMCYAEIRHMNSKINTPVSTWVTTWRSDSHNLGRAWLVLDSGMMVQGLRRLLGVPAERPGRSSLWWATGHMQTGPQSFQTLPSACPLRWIFGGSLSPALVPPLTLFQGFPLTGCCWLLWVKVSEPSEPYYLVQAFHVGVPSRSFLTLGMRPRQALTLINLDIWRKKLFLNYPGMCYRSWKLWYQIDSLLFFNSSIRISNI